MASMKVVGVLLVCLVILHVNHAQNAALAPEAKEATPDADAQDGNKCYDDCEKSCIDEGNARSFCMLKCEKECRKGYIARRFSR